MDLPFFQQNTSIHIGKGWDIGPEAPDWLMLQGSVLSPTLYNMWYHECIHYTQLYIDTPCYREMMSIFYSKELEDWLWMGEKSLELNQANWNCGLFIQIFCWHQCFLWTDFNYLWRSTFANLHKWIILKHQVETIVRGTFH